jgi:serine/threonine protein kinase
MKGTIVWHPPEIVQLKKMSKSSKPKVSTPTLYWSYASDVYSYGIVGYVLFHGEIKRPSDGIDETVHELLIGRLRKSGTMLDEVLETMLAWDLGLRPEMREVLLRPLWDNPETPFHSGKRHFPGS